MMCAAILCCAAGLGACSDDDDYDYSQMLPNALVTVKTAADERCYLQLDDSTTLMPVNMKTSPFGKKEVRALVNFNPSDAASGAYSKAVTINWIDSILTKPLAEDLGGVRNDEVYGTDPVDMVADWVTIAEDGYLTLRFRIGINGNSMKRHFVNLLAGTNPDNPYEVEFRHNAYGDNGSMPSDGLVAFRLDRLPDTQGKTVKLTLKWKSPEGEKRATFNYRTRKATATNAAAAIASTRSQALLR